MPDVEVTFYENFHQVDNSNVGFSFGGTYFDGEEIKHRRFKVRVLATGGSYRLKLASIHFNLIETLTTRTTAPIAWNASGEAIAAALEAISELEPSGAWTWTGTDLGNDEYQLDCRAVQSETTIFLPEGVGTEDDSLSGYLVWDWDETSYVTSLVAGGCASSIPEGDVAAEGDSAGVVPVKKRIVGGRGSSELRPPDPPPPLIHDEFRHDVLELDEANLTEAWRVHQQLEEYESTSWVKRYQAGLDLFQKTLSEAHTFDYSWLIPLIDNAQFVVPAEFENPRREGFFGWRFFLKVNGVYQRSFRGGWMFGFMANPRQVRTHVEWRNLSTQFDGSSLVPASAAAWLAASQQVFIPNGEEASEEFGPNSRLFEDAKTGGTPLPKPEGMSIALDKGDVVTIHARALGLEYFSTGTTEEPDNLERASSRTGWMAEQVAASLPRLPFAYRTYDPA